MSHLESFSYDDKVVAKFVWATLFWGVVGMLVGVLIATQLFFRPMNFDTSWLTFGRLRPLHTNAVIFAFCLNGVFAGIYHSSQRLLKARMWNDTLSNIHFWGWQLIIVAAAITLPLGLSTSKEYAELEWPIAILITLVWVVFALNFFMTIAKRREKTLYVSIWFYIATILTIALLHIVNHLALPVSFWKSYPIYGGIRDALVQWWYGHNAVAFVLTTPFLGLGYYYIPKLAQRPVASYRLSVLHFWTLIFIYMWAGPHHLLYTSLPVWLQSLGVVFSIMLLAPSWGGGFNFLYTMKPAWKDIKSHPSTPFFISACVYYLIAVTEGPLMSIRAVNRISHYTDWTIGHAHGGALGWNGFILFGMFYWLVPKLYRTELRCVNLVRWHFRLASLGIVLYLVSMLISGLAMGFMRESITDGVLTYPSFFAIVYKLLPLQAVRALGGLLYLMGLCFGTWALVRTALAGRCEDTAAQAAALMPPEQKNPFLAYASVQAILENWGVAMGITAFVTVSIAGLVQLVPVMAERNDMQEAISTLNPYTPLELEGRDLYIREGCNNCHSQQVRGFHAEEMRYGPASQMGEFNYDFPHLWGSKQTGPDLQREGQKYPNMWHYQHFIDPRLMTPNSTMPRYDWLARNVLDTSDIENKMWVLNHLGVPYTASDIANAKAAMHQQAVGIVQTLKQQQPDANPDTEIIALIAYMQRLGVDGKAILHTQKGN